MKLTKIAMKKNTLVFLVFILVSVLDIIGISFKINALTYVFKPLIIVSLLSLYVLTVTVKNRFYLVALLFSFLGDVLLLFSGEGFFILGLLSFLIAHSLFIVIVVGYIKKIAVIPIGLSIILFAIPFGLLIYILGDSLREMLIPVIIYGLTIATFGIVSHTYFNIDKSKKSMYMITGAVVFMISDSILAINKFYYPTLIFEIMVMITYVLAQYLIFKSMVLDKIKE